MRLLISTIISLFICLNVYSAAETMYVTVSGAGDNSGDSWANAMALSDFDTDLTTNSEAGDIYYIEEGTYTLTEDLSTGNDGTTTNLISFIGVKSGTSNQPPVASDWAYGDNRPLFACSSYAFSVDNYFLFRNIRSTGVDPSLLAIDIGGIFINCKAHNSSETADRDAFSLDGTDYIMLYCEGISNNGYAIGAAGDGKVASSYFHDSKVGADVSVEVAVIGNIFDTCTTGLEVSGDNLIMNNTFYNNTTGLDGGTSEALAIVNNFFDNNATGATVDTALDSNILENNVWSNNTTDVTNLTKGGNAVTSDISLTDPANGDFTLPDSSNAEDAGMCVGVNTGATGSYTWNIGADQTDTQSGGAGGGTYGGSFTNF